MRVAEHRARFSSLHPDTRSKLQQLEIRLIHEGRKRGRAIERLDDPRRRRGPRAAVAALVGYSQAHYGTGKYGGGGS